MEPWLILALGAVAGSVVAGVSLLGLRAAGGRPREARRLAGARGVAVGSLPGRRDLPSRPVRVAGRVRCAAPLHAAEGERLVAYHRDVEVLLPGLGWRSVERVREARSFDLWDHAGSLPVEPSRAAEPLLTIPSVWRGHPSQLGEPHASALRRLEERHGLTASEARSTSRSLSVTDHLLVLARVAAGPRGMTLEPPDGGYLITNLTLPEAMRLLGGRRRGLLRLSIAGLAVGAALVTGGIVGALVTAALQR